ncbi:MAG: hypothetical protein LBV45_09510 [Xanthomonadaceae bacterium]|jgi:hypothetical protein|nr:hypothetical protein [Xanthomonadaceae bacterium]
MISKPIALSLVIALATGLSLTGCGRQEAPPPMPSASAPAPASAHVAAATVSVVTATVGTTIDADRKVATPTSLFKSTDTIYLSVGTATSDPAATVPGTLDVKWTYQDGQVVSEESVDIEFSGEGATEFHISKPDGFPAGKYKVEVSLNGDLVQAREFSVR